MIKIVSRRRFLKISAATFGANAIVTHVPFPCAFGESGGTATENVEKTATLCEMCGWFCGAIAHVRDGPVMVGGGQASWMVATAGR